MKKEEAEASYNLIRKILLFPFYLVELIFLWIVLSPFTLFMPLILCDSLEGYKRNIKELFEESSKWYFEGIFTN